MALRGIRGAITARANTKDAIVSATTELLEALLRDNHLETEDIATIFFSVTADLTAEFPAVAARKLGLVDTPLLCLMEIPVVESLSSCIRILIQVNSELPQKDMVHHYLRDAASLRPDKKGRIPN